MHETPVALITGGARRVGCAIALELARAGHDVAIHYRSSEVDALRTVKEIEGFGRRAVAIKAELEYPSAWPVLIDETVRRLGRLDALINNASQFLTDKPDTLDAFDLGSWERMLRVNLVAPVALAHHAAPRLAFGGRGCVVNLLDAGLDRPWPAHLAYFASKSGLASMTKALARALAPAVRVNAVAPGIAVFPESYDDRTRQTLVSRVPLGREGMPEDVAGAVRYLVMEGTYITGETIVVDGGRRAAP